MKDSSIFTSFASKASQTHPYLPRRIPDHFCRVGFRISRSKTLLAVLCSLAAKSSSGNPRFVQSFSANSYSTLTRKKVARTATGTPFSTKLMLPSTQGNSADELQEIQSPWKLFPSWQYNRLVEKHGVDRVKLIYTVRHAEGTHNVNRNYKGIEHIDARLTPLGIEQCLELRDKLLRVKDDIIVKNSRSLDGAANSDLHRRGLEYLMGSMGGIRSDEEGTKKDNDICVVVSPLTRCIQTAMHSFEFFAPTASAMGLQKNNNDARNNKIDIPFMSLEALRETVNYNCDRRRSISEVADEFPHVDFSFCQSDDDEIWLSYRAQEKDQERVVVGDMLVDTNTQPMEKKYLESAQLYVVANRGRQAMNFIQSLPQTKIVVCTHSAYLRCILNWGQTGGVPRMFDQRLDDREDPTRQDKLFEYCFENDECAESSTDEKYQKIPELDRTSFEEYMRTDYENAELRSFCLLVQQTT